MINWINYNTGMFQTTQRMIFMHLLATPKLLSVCWNVTVKWPLTLIQWNAGIPTNKMNAHGSGENVDDVEPKTFNDSHHRFLVEYSITRTALHESLNFSITSKRHMLKIQGVAHHKILRDTRSKYLPTKERRSGIIVSCCGNHIYVYTKSITNIAKLSQTASTKPVGQINIWLLASRRSFRGSPLKRGIIASLSTLPKNVTHRKEFFAIFRKKNHNVKSNKSNSDCEDPTKNRPKHGPAAEISRLWRRGLDRLPNHRYPRPIRRHCRVRLTCRQFIHRSRGSQSPPTKLRHL